MQTPPEKHERANYGCDADIMMTIAEGKMKDLIAQKVDRNYAERTQMPIQEQIEETLVDVLQLGNNDSPNEIKTASARVLQMIMIEYRLTQVYAETDKVDRKEVPLSPGRSLSDSTKKSENYDETQEFQELRKKEKS